jgi:hypothetical protein
MAASAKYLTSKVILRLKMPSRENDGKFLDTISDRKFFERWFAYNHSDVYLYRRLGEKKPRKTQNVR